MDVLKRSRIFDTISVFFKFITVIRKRSSEKQHRTSCNVTDFPQNNKNKNVTTTMEHFL